MCGEKLYKYRMSTILKITILQQPKMAVVRMFSQLNDMEKSIIISVAILSVLSCGSASVKTSDKKVDAEKKRIAELGIKSQTEFTYLWVDSIKKYSDQKIKSSFVQYDNLGNVTEEIRYDMNGSEHSKKTSEFDTKDKLKSHSDYFNGKLSYKVIKDFDKDGREIGF